jgi:hypothetical protein
MRRKKEARGERREEEDELKGAGGRRGDILCRCFLWFGFRLGIQLA